MCICVVGIFCYVENGSSYAMQEVRRSVDIDPAGYVTVQRTAGEPQPG
jgi:hypothetical protein